jgi:gas vesicle protein
MADQLQAEVESDLSGKLLWFLAGATIGAAAALLLAPQSGKETRKAISRTAARGREAVSGTSKDLVEGGREMFDHGKRLVQDATDLFERGRKLVRG